MATSTFTLANLVDVAALSTIQAVAGSSFVMTSPGTLLVNAAAGAYAVTLPTPAQMAIGQRVTVKKTETSANAITVTPPSGQIDNAATATVAGGALNKATYAWDGANWWIVA